MDEIRTVGQLCEALRFSEDEEPIIFDLEDNSRREKLKCVGVSSSGGGRITVVHFDRINRKGLEYTI